MPEIRVDASEVRRNAELVLKTKKEMAKIFFGHEEVVSSLIRALLCDSHVLLEGVPGIAKTLVIKVLAKVSGCTSNRIQFTVDLLPTDIVGLTTYDPQKGFEIVKGPVFANFVIADEINRSPPKCVLGDTPIITGNGEIGDIREIIKNYNGKKTIKENNEYWIIPRKTLKLPAFDPSDCKIKLEEVKYLYKQKTREPYHKIRLKTGREIKTSSIHPFFTLKDGKVKNISAKDIKEGDCVLIPKIIRVEGDNSLVCDKELTEKSEKIASEIERRKELYNKVKANESFGLRKIIKILNIEDKDIELLRTFLRGKPKYINYNVQDMFFVESKQFGQVSAVKKPKLMSKEFAQFMAILIAEGNVTGTYFYLTMKNKEIPELFIKLAEIIFGIKANLLFDNKREQYRVAFSSQALVGLLNSLGYNPHLKAGKKYIPGFILKSSDDITREFLKIYYDCDGCVSRDCVKITTKSKKIANSISYLLLRHGFVAKISRELTKTNINDYKYERRFYNLRLYGADLFDFSEKIGFYTKQNNEKLKNLIKTADRYKTDLIPGMHGLIRDFRKENFITHKEFFNLAGMHAHNLENPNNSLMHSRSRLNKIVNLTKQNSSNIDQIRKLANGDFYCDFIKSNKLIQPKKDYWLYDFSMKNTHSFIAGFGGIISHNTQSAMLEAMQERQVTIGKKTFTLPHPFFVMATQNPLETEGVYTLPEAQVDRFIFKIVYGYPDEKAEKKVMEDNTTFKKFEDIELRSILTPEKIEDMQKLTHRIYLDEKIKQYILDIITKTRKKDFKYGEYIELGGSPRASIFLFIAAKAEALLQGRNFVIPKDVDNIAYDVLRHRVILSYRAQAEGISVEKVIDEVLSNVRAP